MGEKETCPDPAVIIDIPEELEPNLEVTCWIQRVPRKLRQVKKEAYTPKLVSIGPFHHGEPELKAMEHHKAKYYDKFWERDFCKHIRDKDMIKDFTSRVDRRQRIRKSYAGTFDQPLNYGDHFFEVILRDSCFIFELFLRNYEYLLYIEECWHEEKIQEEIRDYILRTPCLRKAIELDFIMLENQLPYFVFTELFEFILDNQPKNQRDLKIPPYLSKHQESDHSDLPEHQKKCNFITTITSEFFADYYLNGKVVDKEKKSRGVEKERKDGEDGKDGKGLFKCFTSLLCGSNEPPRLVTKPVFFISDLFESEEMQRFKEIKHFTDLVRQFLRPDSYAVDPKNMRTSCCYSAKELDRAGVYFSKCEDKFLADIDKKKCECVFWNSLTLKIPQFKVEDNTECLMRNVMALEQCLYPYKAHICNYIALLDQLINTDEDVEFLVQNKVVDNLLGSSNAVANLINTLGDEIVETSFCYGAICKQLNEHHENWWNVTKATLKRVYFKDIWTGSSTIVAVVVLIFSILSVISTIKNLFF